MHCPRFEQADESNYFVKTSCRIMTMDHHLTLYLLVEGATTRIKNPKAGNECGRTLLNGARAPSSTRQAKVLIRDTSTSNAS